MRNKSLDNLQQVCLTDTVDFTFASPEEPCAELLAKARGAYVSRLKRCSSSWPTGSLDTACAYPVLITQSHHEELYELHQALNLAIEDIIARWWKDEQAQFPQRMPLKPDEEDLLRWIDSSKHLFRPWNERQGSWRPDFLVELDEAGKEVFRLCEINARFCWNGFMHGGFGQDSLSEFDIESRGLMHCVEGEAIIGSLFKLFETKLPLHLVKGKEYGIDIFMFVEFASKLLGIKPRLITPESLRIIPDCSEISGFKLYCLVQPGAVEPDAVNTITTESGDILEEVQQLGLELHQQELNALDPEMKRQISVRCFNDMRTILLAHDKRMLGIVLEELDRSLVSRNIITPRQAGYLRRGIIPTIIPGSTVLKYFVKNCRQSEVLHKEYILKPIRGGKGAGIIFGDEIDHATWLKLIDQMQCPQLQVEDGKTLFVVQRKMIQPKYDVLLSDGNLHRCHMVGTYHAVNGEYIGLGTWRCGPGRLCAVSDGATWICSVRHNNAS